MLGIATHERLDECPYDIALQEWLDARYPTTVVRSRVYVNLGNLANKGLVTRETVTDRTTAYRLTADGTACLAAHSRFVDALYPPEMSPATARDQ